MGYIPIVPIETNKSTENHNKTVVQTKKLLHLFYQLINSNVVNKRSCIVFTIPNITYFK